VEDYILYLSVINIKKVYSNKHNKKKTKCVARNNAAFIPNVNNVRVSFLLCFVRGILSIMWKGVTPYTWLVTDYSVNHSCVRSQYINTFPV
jgi:thiamine transporter ThiT